MQAEKFPYEQHLLKLKEGESDILFIKGKAFIIRPASADEIEEVGKGFFILD